MNVKTMIKFKLYARTVKANNGNVFTAYRVYSKDGKKTMDAKFTRESGFKDPGVSDFYEYANEEEVNVSRTGRYPVMWFRSVDHIEKIEKEAEDFSEYAY